MKQQKWFDRKFDFINDASLFPLLLERLEGTRVLLNHKVQAMAKSILKNKVNGKWSIQEHVSHLIYLEPVW